MTMTAALFQRLADYNQWMNAKLYAAAAQLPPGELLAERGAYFGSLFGTLSHLVVADTLWLKRFRGHHAGARVLAALDGEPWPTALDARPFVDLPALHQRRGQLDTLILAWTATLEGHDLSEPFAYANLRGQPQRRSLDGLLLHFFNHQTHHRGQATTLLMQAGVDPGPTDLLLRLPDLAD